MATGKVSGARNGLRRRMHPYGSERIMVIIMDNPETIESDKEVKFDIEPGVEPGGNQDLGTQTEEVQDEMMEDLQGDLNDEVDEEFSSVGELVSRLESQVDSRFQQLQSTFREEWKANASYFEQLMAEHRSERQEWDARLKGVEAQEKNLYSTPAPALQTPTPSKQGPRILFTPRSVRRNSNGNSQDNDPGDGPEFRTNRFDPKKLHKWGGKSSLPFERWVNLIKLDADLMQVSDRQLVEYAPYYLEDLALTQYEDWMLHSPEEDQTFHEMCSILKKKTMGVKSKAEYMAEVWSLKQPAGETFGDYHIRLNSLLHKAEKTMDSVTEEERIAILKKGAHPSLHDDLMKTPLTSMDTLLSHARILEKAITDKRGDRKTLTNPMNFFTGKGNSRDTNTKTRREDRSGFNPSPEAKKKPVLLCTYDKCRKTGHDLKTCWEYHADVLKECFRCKSKIHDGGLKNCPLFKKRNSSFQKKSFNMMASESMAMTATIPIEISGTGGDFNTQGHVALVDTGSASTILKKGVLEKLPEKFRRLLEESRYDIVVGDGQRIRASGQIMLNIGEGQLKDSEVLVQVLDSSAEWDLILGRDILAKMEAVIECRKQGEVILRLNNARLRKALNASPEVSTLQVYENATIGMNATTTSSKADKSLGDKSSGDEGTGGVNELDPYPQHEVSGNDVRSILGLPVESSAHAEPGWEFSDEANVPHELKEPPFSTSAEVPDSRLGGLLDTVEGNDLLSSEQKAQVKDMLKKHSGAFAVHLNQLPKEGFKGEEFSISVKNPESLSRAVMYKSSEADRDYLRQQVSMLLEAKLIRRANATKIAFPALVAREKGRDPRFVTNFAKLNATLEVDPYPLPTIETILQDLSQFKYFITVDMKSGYWQFVVEEKSRKYTAFVTRDGVYEYLRVPMGISTAPSFFQRMSDTICRLVGPENMMAYLDDLLIGANSVEHLMRLLEGLLQFCLKHRLVLHPGKCFVFMTEIDVLGHHVGALGITPMGKLLKRISAQVIPQSVDDIRHFLGTVGFYQKFIPGFAQKASPLTDLMVKGVKFSWGQSEQEAFETLRSILRSDTLLIRANSSKHFYLTVDASLKGVGAALEQKSDKDEMRPVVFASKKLSKAQQKYSSAQRECLGLLWAVQRFHYYLHGREFTVYTDLTSLQWLGTAKDHKAMFGRWAANLMEYRFTVIHVPGKSIPHVDGLSRFNCMTMTVLDPRPREVLELYYTVKEIKEYLTDGITPQGWTAGEVRIFLKQVHRYRIVGNEVMILRKGDWKQLPSPESRRVLVKTYHERSHAGAAKVIADLKLKYYWRTMDEEVLRQVDGCNGCRRGKSRVPQKTVLQYPGIPWKPFNWITMDLVGPLLITPRGHKFILVVQCYLTKYVLLFPIKAKCALSVAAVLWYEVFMIYGCPKRISSDNGTEFNNMFLDGMCIALDIGKTLSARYHPMSQGSVERFNGTLTNYLGRMLTPEKENLWDMEVRRLQFGYNSSVHSALRGVSPHALVYGYQPEMPLDVILDPMVVMEWTDEEVLGMFQRNLERRKGLIEAVHESILRHRISVNSGRVLGQTNTFKEGMLVMRKNPNPSKLGTTSWLGPYVVMEAMESGGLRVQLDTGEVILINHRDAKRFHLTEPGGVEAELLEGGVAAEDTTPDTPEVTEEKTIPEAVEEVKVNETMGGGHPEERKVEEGIHGTQEGHEHRGVPVTGRQRRRSSRLQERR